MSTTNKKQKEQKRSHPWRVWVPKKDKPAEEVAKWDRIPSSARMGVRL